MFRAGPLFGRPRVDVARPELQQRAPAGADEPGPPVLPLHVDPDPLFELGAPRHHPGVDRPDVGNEQVAFAGELAGHVVGEEVDVELEPAGALDLHRVERPGVVQDEAYVREQVGEEVEVEPGSGPGVNEDRLGVRAQAGLGEVEVDELDLLQEQLPLAPVEVQTASTRG